MSKKLRVAKYQSIKGTDPIYGALALPCGVVGVGVGVYHTLKTGDIQTGALITATSGGLAMAAIAAGSMSSRKYE